MSLRETIIADVQTIESDLEEQEFTWKGETYICFPGSHGEMGVLEEGGFGVDADLIVNVRKELFTDDIFPRSQQKITFSGKEYRIITARTDATNAFLRLFCQDVARGI